MKHPPTERLSADLLDGLRGWDDLEPKDKTLIREESQAVINSLTLENTSRLAVGEHLVAIQQILEPKGMFAAFLRHTLHMAASSAYHYINQYKLAQKRLPAQVISIAMRRGINIKARTLRAIEETPPPRTDDPDKIEDYLRGLRKPVISIARYKPSDFQKDCINFIRLRWNHLPNNSKTRTESMRDLIGMEMNLMGIASSGSFDPIAIPEDFTPVRGRPRKKAA